MTGLYVHIPFCRSRCSYCGFVSSSGCFNQSEYVSSLIKEIGERVSGKVNTVYIGGGTPSVLERGLLSGIFSAIRNNAEISPDCEITSEANPDSCTDEFLEEIKKCGVNRLSLGVQSLNYGVLRNIGRRHNAEQAKKAVFRAQKHGLKNISCDIMLGLPGQTEKDIEYAVDELCAWGIKHLSVYALSVEDGTALYNSGYKVDEDLSAEMYETAYNLLKSYGMKRYEVSNFCFDGYICRHNYKYWTREPYIGLGAAAHSFDGNARYCNTSDIARYIAGKCFESSYEISADEALEEYIMLGLRTEKGIGFSTLNKLSGCDWKTSKHKRLKELTDGGFVKSDDCGLRLTEKAYYVMNEIIVRLL